MKRFTLRVATAVLAAGLATAVAAPATAKQSAAPEAAVQNAPRPSVRPQAERVVFPSMDEARTELVGYLYAPANPAEGKAPAVVLMHGRAGAYSSLANGVYDASTVSRRHRYWAQYWAGRGYYALVIDSFGPRGFPGGFPAGSYSSRPSNVNEVTVRPLDAYGALRFLRGLDGVDGDRVGLMGWSNGGSAVLAAMADDKPGDMSRLGFRAAVSMYPGCGLQNRFRRGYRAYAPVEIFIGTADEEVSHDRCRTFAASANAPAQGAAGAPVGFNSFADATHSFDDPGRRRQSVPANATATQTVRERLAAYFERALAPR